MKISTSIRFQKAIRHNVPQPISQVKNYSLKTMNKDIINNEELKCEYTSEKHKRFRQTLEEGKVNARASNCKRYMKSLFDVIYPEGINPRKK